MTANPDRKAIARRIRALRAKTVENGCTEEEAVSAAEMLANLLARYNMTLDEAEVRQSPFDHHTEAWDDLTGARLWKIADGIAHLIGVRYWQSSAGVRPIEINFFGLAHEVEVARYMLEICAGAMRRHHSAMITDNPRLFSAARQRRVIGPFLDGMADRLRDRIRAMVPPRPPGSGLVLLKNELIEREMPARIKSRPAVGSRRLEDGYLDGLIAGDRVALNRGLQNRDSVSGLLN